jgi:hypothetical protein
MPTKRQVAANQRNARLSTGPTTEDGKVRSAQNSTLHGLLAREAVLPEEDPGHFRDLLAALEAEFRPSGPCQEFLIREMASAQWRLRRHLRIETGLFIGRMKMVRRWDFKERPTDPVEPSTPEELHDRNTLILGTAFFDNSRGDPFPKLSRYENTLRRAYYKALQTLEESQAAKPVPNEPKSPPSPPPDTPIEAMDSPASSTPLPASDESYILQSGGFGSWTPFWRCIGFTSPSPSRSTICSRSSPWALPC